MKTEENYGIVIFMDDPRGLRKLRTSEHWFDSEEERNQGFRDTHRNVYGSCWSVEKLNESPDGTKYLTDFPNRKYIP